MLHQTFANSPVAALHQRKDAGMDAAGQDGGLDRLSHQLGSAGVRRMAFDDHGASGRQSRCGVAACGRERQRKVRGAKHRNRADRALGHLEVGTRRGFAVGQGRIMAAVQIVARADMGGKQAQLAGGAAALAFQPCHGQAGFRGADGGDLDPARLDLIGNAVKEDRALFTGQGGIAGIGRLGALDRRIDMGGRADGKGQRLARGGRGQEGCVAGHPVACNQMFSGQHVGLLDQAAGGFTPPDPCGIFRDR